MKSFTWDAEKVNAGINLQADDRLGLVVYLGEEGRGRRYEKVALDRRSPAEVIDGRVFDAHPRKVTLPPKDGKAEKVFFVLERPRPEPDPQVLVRVNTSWCYTRNSVGRWETAAGSPETLISGFGAHGIAGRVGTWADGLVLMKAGDVLRVKPEGGSKTETFALWVDANGQPQAATWRDYENLQAVAAAEQSLETAADEGEPEAGLNLAFGVMPAFTWAGGQISACLRIEKGATGPVIAFGESGRGRTRVEVPLVGVEPVVQHDRYGQATEAVDEAAVAVLHEQVVPARYTNDKPEIKRIYGLTQSTRRETGAYLVRVSTSGPYTKSTTGQIDPWHGSPTVITTGSGAHGAAGYVGGWDDTLMVLREGDALYVRQEGGYKSAGPWALFVEGGELKSELWHPWKVADAQRDPAFYVAKGTAPWGHVPAEWVGKVATVCDLSKEQTGCGPEKSTLQDRVTGELISVSPSEIILNLGWDGRDSHHVTVKDGTWVRLDTDKRVYRLEGDEAEQRRELRTATDTLQKQAVAAMEAQEFGYTDSVLRASLMELSKEQLAILSTTGWGGLDEWAEKAKHVLARWEAALPELRSAQSGSAIRELDVTCDTRYNRGRVWVIKPDGELRPNDETEYHKRTTTFRWVNISTEVVLVEGVDSIQAPNTRLPIVMGTGVVWRPAQVTPAQVEAVNQIEREHGLVGTFAVSDDLVARRERQMEEIRKEILRVVPRVRPIDLKGLKFLEVAGPTGACLHYQGDGASYVSHLLNRARPTDETIGAKPADLVATVRVADGVLEFLSYTKWGGMNVNARWRELREDERAAVPPVGQAPTSQGPAPAADAQRKLSADEVRAQLANLNGGKFRIR